MHLTKLILSTQILICRGTLFKSIFCQEIKPFFAQSCILERHTCILSLLLSRSQKPCLGASSLPLYQIPFKTFLCKLGMKPRTYAGIGNHHFFTTPCHSITDNSLPGCLGIIVTCTCTVLLYFCCNKRQIWLFFKEIVSLQYFAYLSP